MPERGIKGVKSNSQGKVIFIVDSSEEDIENSPVISDFQSDSLLTLSHKDNLNQEENISFKKMNIFLMIWRKHMILRYYADFGNREFESLFYKINICLQKATICIGLQTEQIFSVNN